MSVEDDWASENSYVDIQIGRLEEELRDATQEVYRLRELCAVNGIEASMYQAIPRYDVALVTALLDAIQHNAYLRDDCVRVTDLVYQVRESLEPKR